jgi:hypothetical protein
MLTITPTLSGITGQSSNSILVRMAMRRRAATAAFA